MRVGTAQAEKGWEAEPLTQHPKLDPDLRDEGLGLGPSEEGWRKETQEKVFRPLWRY